MNHCKSRTFDATTQNIPSFNANDNVCLRNKESKESRLKAALLSAATRHVQTLASRRCHYRTNLVVDGNEKAASDLFLFHKVTAKCGHM